MAVSEFTQEELENEEWRDVLRYEGYYAVSSLGRIRRDAAACGARVGRILRYGLVGGYRFVVLSVHNKRQQCRVNRLVLLAFVGLPTIGQQGNHKDGNKENNRILNLEWVTGQENHAHAAKHGLKATGDRSGPRLHPERLVRGENHWTRRFPHRVVRGERVHTAKLTEEDVRRIKRQLARGYLGIHIAHDEQVSASVISKIRRGRTWQHVV